MPGRLLLILAIAASLHAGEIVENVASLADATQTYTLVLPSSYDAAKQHPLLFVFDPRGRGTAAAKIFEDAAEEFGWILISSNQTRSDDDGAASNRAVNALLPEMKRYAVDPRRVYAAGFSGTAILSWAVGIKGGAFAGVIGVGGRVVEEIPPERFSFAHFGFAGDVDFNNRDMRIIDERLERAGKAHRFRQFSAGHRWISPELAREAIAWMEVMAMKEQRRARDASLLTKLYERDVASANALKGVDALRAYREIVRTFDGLLTIDDAKAAVKRLESDASVQHEAKDLAKWDAFEAQGMRDAPSLLKRVGELKRRAARAGAEGVTARRMLEAVFTQTSFYLPRDLMEKGDYARAAAMLEIAADIHPERWRLWYELAVMQRRAGNRRKALQSLEKAFAVLTDGIVR
ncbi:MAG TPA: tetratricopeptide repeat protein [Thermoanaerobaculia bacterium]|nr:tetratricopeptide repeat protein [Thermoanaerobaculia bacterium]